MYLFIFKVNDHQQIQKTLESNSNTVMILESLSFRGGSMSIYHYNQEITSCFRLHITLLTGLILEIY